MRERGWGEGQKVHETYTMHDESHPTDNPTPRRGFNPALLLLLIIPMLGAMFALILLVRFDALPRAADPTPLPATAPAPALVGGPAPNFELETLYGGSVRLSSLRGRLVFLNFWATWCEPCKRELPAFQAFMAEQESGGPIILAINAGETDTQIRAFLNEYDVAGIPILLDPDFRINDTYNADRIPITYVIDAAGMVRDWHLGEMTPDDLQEYVAQYSNDS